eukprot:8519016-Alexandrium_andersonii.AAC.1
MGAACALPKRTFQPKGNGKGGKGGAPDQQGSGGAKGEGKGGEAVQGQCWKCHEVGRRAAECPRDQGKAPARKLEEGALRARRSLPRRPQATSGTSRRGC